MAGGGEKEVQGITRWVVLAAVATGLALALSLSGYDVFWLAWFAWVPLLMIVMRGRLRVAMSAGAIAGAVQVMTMLYWLPGTVVRMGKSLPLGLLLLAILVCVWSACLAGFSGLACHLHRGLLRADARYPVLRNLALVLMLPVLWVAFEYLFTSTMTALPWLFFLLGYSQWNHPGVLQLAALTGVFGVSFLIMLVNSGLAHAVTQRRLLPLCIAIGLTGLVCGVGWQRVETAVSGGGIKVAVLQGNVDPRQKLDPTSGDALAHLYLDLSRTAGAAGADLVIWTESAIPWPIRDDDDLVRAALDTTGSSGACHLIGAPVESKAQPGTYQNAALMVQPDGNITGLYGKRRPLKLAEAGVRLPGSSHATKLHPSQADYVAGLRPNVLRGARLAVGITICNENFYPDLVRTAVREGAELLVNMTNDGWFRWNTPLRQHFMLNPLRAVESGLPTVVANNVGISAIIDPFGRQQHRSAMREATCLVGNVSRRSGRTLYASIGNLFAQLCLAGSIALVLAKPTRMVWRRSK